MAEPERELQTTPDTLFLESQRPSQLTSSLQTTCWKTQSQANHGKQCCGPWEGTSTERMLTRPWQSRRLSTILPADGSPDRLLQGEVCIDQAVQQRQAKEAQQQFHHLYTGWDTLHCCRWPVNLPSCIRSSLSALGLAMLRVHMETLRAFCCHPAGQSLPAISQQPADAGGESITARPWLYSCATTS